MRQSSLLLKAAPSFLILLLLPGSLLRAEVMRRQPDTLRLESSQEPEELEFLQPFVEPLPIPAVIRLDQQPSIALAAYKTTHKFHRDLPPTLVYAYGTSPESASVPGPTLQAATDTPVAVQWSNNITDKQHILPVDYTTGAPKPPRGGVPMVPHLHGMTAESASDGYPDAWFTAFGDVGPAYVKKNYTYPNAQPGSTLWYHDHTIGMTRLNAKAGLYGMYILRDRAKEAELNLPNGANDVPLIFGDMSFDPDGDVFYPEHADNPKFHTSWKPENFGKFPVVNGKVAPFFEAQPAVYRFRILNAASARFLNLTLCVTELNSTQISTLHPDTPPEANGTASAYNGARAPAPVPGEPHRGPKRLNCSALLPVVQIATDAGFLPTALSLPSLFIGPGQRAEILVDFSQIPSTQALILTNSAPIPYPGGDDDNDDGIEQLMMFNVTSNAGVAIKTSIVAPILEVLATPTPLDVTAAVNYPLGRNISLSELDDSNGDPIVDLLQGMHWMDAVTITPHLGTSEIWNYINLTPDAHPVHFHFVPQRIIYRRPLNVTLFTSNACTFDNGSCFIGDPIPPAANEVALLDTVVVYPEMVTRVLVDFGPKDRNITFDPTQGPGYVIHCHILDHEDSDMMRPVKMLQNLENATKGTRSVGPAGFTAVLVLLFVFFF